MNRFSLLTFNIAHGRGRSPVQGISSHGKILRTVAGIAKLIKESGADIVAIQEVDFDSTWNRRHNLLSLIAEHTGLPEQVMGVNTIRDGRFQLNYGNALLTLLPSSGKTYPSFWPQYTLDFVLLPPGFQVQGETVLRTQLSDHRPVLVHFEVPMITCANE